MRRIWITVVALLVMVSLVSLAQALRGEVCYSSPPVATNTPNTLENTTTFKCQALGLVTIPQIYQKGWKVVHLSFETMYSHGTSTMIDPNDPLEGHTMWMILIEGP
jgi:hypothetical protein